MLSSALAYFFALSLTLVLGGLLAFLVKALMALVVFAILAASSSGSKNRTYGNDSPQVLTVEFLSNIFYGYMANSIGIWVFTYMQVRIDWFYPLFMLFAFIWFDLTRMRNEKQRIKNFDSKGLRDRLPKEIFQNGIAEENKSLPDFNKEKMVNMFTNLRLTALFGKIAGVVIGGLQLIIRAS